MHCLSQKSVNKSKGGAVLLTPPLIRDMKISDCERLMIAWDELAMPNLVQVIKEKEVPYRWPQTLDLMIECLFIQTHGDKEEYLPNKIKQWLTFMHVQQTQALIFYIKLEK